METLGQDTGFTATYVSPEHLLKGVVSPASDIYSFGISVYRVVVNGDTPERDLFGPFLRLDRNNYRRAMDQMRDQDTAESLGMVTPRMVDARIPNKGLANVIKSCIEIDPRERPSASEVRSELMRHI